MNGIVFGGLLGAAAAMYFSRSNRSFSLAGMSSAGQALDNIVEKARSRMMAPDKRSYYGGGTTNTMANTTANATANSAMNNASSSMSNSTSTAGGLERVGDIVKKDPALQNEVDDILQEGR